MANIFSLPMLVVLVAAIVAAWTDIRRFRIYNALTLPLVVSGMVYHGWLHGWSGLGHSSAGIVLGFALLIGPYILGLMGAGDVKLLMGVGAWLGPYMLLAVFAASSLVVGTIAIGMIIYRGKLRESWVTLQVIFMKFAVLGTHFGKDDMLEAALRAPDRRLRVFPFAAAVPIGVLAVLMLLRSMTS